MLTDHNASRFVDDALWLEGRLERKDGETAAACDSMDELLGLSRDDGRPPSRFTRCLQLLCPSMPAGDKPCADYISRELVNDPEMQPAEITGPVPLPQESRFTE